MPVSVALAFVRAFLRALVCPHASPRVELWAGYDRAGTYTLEPVMRCECGVTFGGNVRGGVDGHVA